MTRPRTLTGLSSVWASPAAGESRRAATARGAAIRLRCAGPEPPFRAGTRTPSAIIGELHVEAQGRIAQHLDGSLQFVLALSLDPHLIALDRRLHLEPARLEDLHDLFRLIL